MNPMTAAPLFEARHVSKAFPGVQALDDVSLALYPGEVHVLVGQNGAGKSTLMKTIYGAYHPDRGEFLFDGVPVRIESPADGRRLGVAVMFQEFSLVPYLDVAQNVFLGREPRGRIPGTVDRARMHVEARALLSRLGVELDTRTLVHRLGVAHQQIVEIAKALSQQARVVVMDEPTAALSDPEIERLFAIIRTLTSHHVAIVYISHRLHEIFQIGDRITVLRDGRKIAEMVPRDTNAGELVRLMIGREIGTTTRQRFCDRPGEVLLDVRAVSTRNGARSASLRLHAGEIVGLAGLVGAGRTELVRAIFGADPITAGEIVAGAARLGKQPPAAVRAGVALVPEDRKRQGLALPRSVQDNLLLAAYRRLFPIGWYRPARAVAESRELVATLRIATPSPRRPVKFLSGGNQQKVVIGKWLEAGSRVFLFDEPTRGIDVGAKAEIYALMDDLVAKGAAVLMISSELPEIVAVCDRAFPAQWDPKLGIHVT